MPDPTPTPEPVKRYTVRSTAGRMRRSATFNLVCLAATLLSLVILVVLLASILNQGLGSLSWGFLTSLNSSYAEEAGVKTSLVGTVFIVAICALSAIPLGVGTAILIEEFKPRHRVLLAVHAVIDTNIRNLAGVPSIVYGILGVSMFAYMFGVFGDVGSGGGITLGQQWFDQYQGEDKHLYYAPRDGSGDADPTSRPASPELEIYRSKDLSEPVSGLTWVTEADIKPRRDAIEEDLDTFEKEFRSQIESARADRRSAVELDPAKAEQIVDASIEAGTWKNDTAELRASLLDLVLDLDGKSGVALITARKDAIRLAVDSEYAARMAGVIMTGREPVRVDEKAWYYVSLPFGRGVLAGGLTLMLVILPIVIVASQESLRAVPGSYRQAALAMGATKWQSVSKTALPAAIPGVCTGTILALSRAIGEAAPILVLGGTGFITSTPRNLMDKFSAMPMTIFQWTKEPEAAFKDIAAAGIIVLMVVLLSFNALAIYIRQRAGRHQ